ncbi:MAG TPA: hypothetical protein VE439_06190 [Anaerolineae bacterium]|jgi:hypothetical protein|nr:hypothetical protein [Anaerolineae bacterium]
MYLDQWVKVIWGSTVVGTSVLGFFNRRWLIVTSLMGLNILQEAFTGW